MRLPPARQVAYGEHPDQVGNLHLPPGEGPWPLASWVAVAGRLPRLLSAGKDGDSP